MKVKRYPSVQPNGKDFRWKRNKNRPSAEYEQEFFSSEEIHIRAGDAIRKDPLVINFDAPTAMLADNKFSFDIDCDGSPDQISRLMAGSGFLSLDLNNDGKINDGSELFGPQSGDGFSDLSLYDSDKNGWIDENDMIFERLRIWTKDEYGNDTLFALGEKGIGAIYLGSAGTTFSLRGEGNEEMVIRKTGIFLRENGNVGPYSMWICLKGKKRASTFLLFPPSVFSYRRFSSYITCLKQNQQ